jgi:hypothetical protein
MYDRGIVGARDEEKVLCLSTRVHHNRQLVWKTIMTRYPTQT